MPRRRVLIVSLSLFCIALAACQSAYYKTMKTFGKEKRDILVKRVIESKKDQEETKEKVKTTLESFQELTGFRGGESREILQKTQLPIRIRTIASQQAPRPHPIHRSSQQRSLQGMAVGDQ